LIVGLSEKGDSIEMIIKENYKEDVK